jgi:hypothetical protein
MSTTVNGKRRATRSASSNVDRQIRHAKVVLRQLRDVLEDLEDRTELNRAKARNAGKPGKDWDSVKKEFGLEF